MHQTNPQKRARKFNAINKHAREHQNSYWYIPLLRGDFDSAVLDKPDTPTQHLTLGCEQLISGKQKIFLGFQNRFTHLQFSEQAENADFKKPVVLRFLLKRTLANV